MASERERQEVDSFERAKLLLLGAVDTVFQIANNKRTQDSPSQSSAAQPVLVRASTPRFAIRSPEGAQSFTSNTSIGATHTLPLTGCCISADQPASMDLVGSAVHQGQGSTGTVSHPTAFTGAPVNNGARPFVAVTHNACTSSRSTDLGSVGLNEHRRLFKLQPSKATKRRKGSAPPNPKRGKRGPSTWKKESICLSSCDQCSIPTTEERMELACMGLRLKELQFDVDGGPVHIHEVILEKYPQLEASGGYSLLRLAENSPKLVEIETPDGGLTVPYLKDIVRQAKLYIRPLQCEILSDDIKPTITQVGNHCVRFSSQTLAFQ